MTTPGRPRAHPAASAHPLDDEVVLYTPSDGQAFVLNRTAARVWALCDGTRTDAEIARAVAASFDEDEAQVLADVRELVQSLLAAGLVTLE